MPLFFGCNTKTLPIDKYNTSTANIVMRTILNAGLIFIFGKDKTLSNAKAPHQKTSVTIKPIGPIQKIRFISDFKPT